MICSIVFLLPLALVIAGGHALQLARVGRERRNKEQLNIFPVRRRQNSKKPQVAKLPSQTTTGCQTKNLVKKNLLLMLLLLLLFAHPAHCSEHTHCALQHAQTMNERLVLGHAGL